MRLLILCLILSATPLSAQSLNNSPLNDDELRLTHGYLLELQKCRKDFNRDEQYIQRESEMDVLEKANFARALELEKQATAQAKEQAEFYRAAYQALSKGPSLGCRVLRVFTLGIHRCN